MLYIEFDPDPAVAGHVLRYWGLRVPATVPASFPHRVIPDGCMGLVASWREGRPWLTLQGPHVLPLIVPVEPGDRYWGIRFRPDAGGLVLGLEPSGLVNTVQSAQPVLGHDGISLAAELAPVQEADEAARVMDRWLRPRILAARRLDSAVRLAVVAIIASAGASPVGELARLVGLSPRQLQRRFRSATGLSPKTYARIRRLRASLDHLIGNMPRTWGQVAADLGFADQAHLGREFTRLAGVTPSEVADYVARIEHRGVRP